MNKSKKVAIVGAGLVGGTTAYTLAMMGVCREIILYDIDVSVAIGKAMDIAQSVPNMARNTKVSAVEDISGLVDCDIVVVTAGVPRKGDMTRDDLLVINAKIMKDVSQNIAIYSPDAVLICVSNPLDILTYVAYKMTGWERHRIIGMAGALDTARIIYEISQKIPDTDKPIKAMMIGEHGQHMSPVPQLSTIGGVLLDEVLTQPDIDDIVKQTKNGGAKIVKQLGYSAYYAPACAICVMVEAILNDSKITVSSSVILHGEYGYDDIAIGVPVVIGGRGVESIISIDLDKQTKDEFRSSVDSIQGGIKILREKGFFKD